MDRVSFIKELTNELAYEVRPSELHQLIDYYDEIILDLMEEGYTEEEAVAKLDDPRKIAQEVAGMPPEIEVKTPIRMQPWLILILILGFPLWGSLLFSGLMVLLSAYLVIWCIPFCTGVFGVAALIGGLTSAIFSPFALQDGLFILLTQFGIGMLFFGLGLLFLLLTYKISGAFIRVSRNLTFWIKDLLTKGRVTRA